MSNPSRIESCISGSARILQVQHVGLTRYADTWRLQREIQGALIAGQGCDTLILCQHFPVITLGRNACEQNLLASRELLAKRGVELLHVERGGDITFHGPGQLVAYPLLDLRRHRQDVHWYMRSLEQVIIQTLKFFGLDSFSLEGKTGVWTSLPAKDYTPAAQVVRPSFAKIASIGVRISRWCTLHGVSINIQDCRGGFELIHPCGFKDIEMGSLEQHGVVADSVGVAHVFEAMFRKLFAYQLHSRSTWNGKEGGAP